MLKIKNINLKILKRFLTIIFLIIFLFSLFNPFFNIRIDSSRKSYNDNSKFNIDFKKDSPPPKISAQWAWINLTNDLEIDGKRFYRNTTITIEGKLYNYTLNPPPPVPNGIPGFKVALIIDGQPHPEFNNITDSNGVFKIQNYTIAFSMNIYSIHKIGAEVIGNKPGDVILNNNFTLYANATSYFYIQSYHWNSPQFAGGNFNLPNYLRFDNNSGIPYQQVNCTWLNEMLKPFSSPKPQFNTNPDGSFKQISIPNDNLSKIMNLNITYEGNSTLIKGAQKLISINVFRNITCVWNTVNSAAEGSIITISGQLFDRNNLTLKLNFTEFTITRNGDSIGSTITDANGIFSFSYQLPTGSAGTNTFNIEHKISSSAISNVTHIISVSSPLLPTAGDIGGGGTKDETPPFQNFLLIFIPIIVGIIVALIIFGYIRFRKQEIESKLVKLPLEDRIRNFKILKDTGRLEEALSYLFQSIYMELVNAKYGKRKKETETIRDFAIISVKEFKLNPASIYPFIQNIEKVIYDKPFLIKENDFYNSVQLFSPVYFELTGYHFVLNF